MTNVNITSKAIEFTSTGLPWSNLIEPKWEAVDETSFHIITEQGVYCITLSDYKINAQKFKTSDDALGYLNSL
jgi:hypothetical protein